MTEVKQDDPRMKAALAMWASYKAFTLENGGFSEVSLQQSFMSGFAAGTQAVAASKPARKWGDK